MGLNSGSLRLGKSVCGVDASACLWHTQISAAEPTTPVDGIGGTEPLVQPPMPVRFVVGSNDNGIG